MPDHQYPAEIELYKRCNTIGSDRRSFGRAEEGEGWRLLKKKERKVAIAETNDDKCMSDNFKNGPRRYKERGDRKQT